jgi:hypothetical protein
MRLPLMTMVLAWIGYCYFNSGLNLIWVVAWQQLQLGEPLLVGLP